MATYRQDITRSIEPAMANPNTLARAAELQASAVKSLVGVAEDVYKGYVAGEVKNIEEKALTAAKDFYITGLAAEEAAEQIPYVKGMQEETLFQSLDKPQMPEAQAGLDRQLKSFDAELVRLKTAVEAGLSVKQYTTRIDTIMREAIAKFPGMADQIRERVASVTGVRGAERWAMNRYIETRLTPPKETKTKTAEEIALKDIDDYGQQGRWGTREELFKLYNENRPEYNRRMTAAKQVRELDTTQKAQEAFVKSKQITDEFEMNQIRPTFTATFAGQLAATVFTDAVMDKEGRYGKVLAQLAIGQSPEVNIVPFETTIKLHQAQMRTNIEGARRAAYAQIDLALSRSTGVSDAYRAKLYEDIDRAAGVALAKYADDKGVGLTAMATILTTYRNKRLDEQVKLADLMVRQVTLMQNNPLVKQFFQGGDARKNVERQYPDFYKKMVEQEEFITGKLSGITGEVDAASSLASLSRTLQQAKGGNGEAVPRDNVDPAPNVRAGHQALFATAKEVLNKSSLEDVDRALVSSAFSTSALYGANSAVWAREYKQIGEQLRKLPDVDLNLIKGNVSRTLTQSWLNIQGIKQAYEQKHKVKLTLGVNDAGEINVVMPEAEQRIPTPRLGTSPGMFTRPSTSMSLAAKEFMNDVKPLLNNMVYGRAMLTQEDVKAVGTDYVTLFNTGKMYEGFFNLNTMSVPEAAPAAAVPAGAVSTLVPTDVNTGRTAVGPGVTATATPATPTASAAKPAATSAAPAADLDTAVKQQLDEMKKQDPDLNTDYMYNAYLRSSPAQKKKLAKLFADKNITMADLNASK